MANETALGQPAGLGTVRPAIRQIGFNDLRAALEAGYDDFSAHRTDVIVLCALYPLLGLAMFRIALGYDVLPLIFPLAAGFALVGPVAAVGLYEMSRRREQGMAVSWRSAFGVLRAPAFGAIVLLGLLMAALLLIWLQTALGIYELCFGAAEPQSIGSFLHGVLATPAGWRLIVLGNAVGAIFAIVAFAVSVVSFPLLVDSAAGRTTAERVSVAIATSLRAVAANPLPMLAWGVIVAVALLLGSIPLFLGLAVVLPVLGHATWHLYRRVVAHG